MPNWVEGTFRARGKKDNIKKFIMEGLSPVSYFEKEEKISKEITCEENNSFFVRFKITEKETGKYKKYVKSLSIEGTRKHFIDDLFCGEINVYENKNKESQFCCPFKSAWAIDTEKIKEIAKKYKIDIRVNGYECGTEFEYVFEVSRKGIIEEDSFIKYDDYAWQCPMPLLGG